MKYKHMIIWVLLTLITPITVYSFCSSCFGGVCLNGCEIGENLDWCDDCINAFCGNTYCDQGAGEDSTTCPQDCPPPCPPPCPDSTYQCPPHSYQLQQCQLVGGCLQWVNTNCDPGSTNCNACSGATWCNPSTLSCEASCGMGFCLQAKPS